MAIESATSSPGNQLTWLLPLTIADKYDVYARWGTSNSGATDAKYTVTHAGGTDTVTLDQTTAYDGSWIKLGTYDLAPDAGHKVTLSDRANGQVAADAIRIVSAGQGERVARWQGSVASAGTYQVWARWTAAPSHSFAATYRVTTPGGTDSVTVDQRSGGGQWHLLKTLTLAANDNWQVELSDQSPGEVAADAVAVTPPISLADKFEWAPMLPAAGDYAVYAKWQAEPGRATDATYEITHDGGVAQVSVDQTNNGGEWRYLGSWSFDPANSPKVTLLGSLTGTLSADAVRFVAGDAIGGDIAYTHSDQLGTIQKMTDAAGSLAWDRTQRPFGETVAISAASSVANQLRFPGQYADETGLNYNFFRDYDPTLGRYLESDPIGLGGGANTYAYASANPVLLKDEFGLFPKNSFGKFEELNSDVPPGGWPEPPLSDKKLEGLTKEQLKKLYEKLRKEGKGEEANKVRRHEKHRGESGKQMQRGQPKMRLSPWDWLWIPPLCDQQIQLIARKLIEVMVKKCA